MVPDGPIISNPLGCPCTGMPPQILPPRLITHVPGMFLFVYKKSKDPALMAKSRRCFCYKSLPSAMFCQVLARHPLWLWFQPIPVPRYGCCPLGLMGPWPCPSHFWPLPGFSHPLQHCCAFSWAIQCGPHHWQMVWKPFVVAARG